MCVCAAATTHDFIRVKKRETKRRWLHVCVSLPIRVRREKFTQRYNGLHWLCLLSKLRYQGLRRRKKISARWHSKILWNRIGANCCLLKEKKTVTRIYIYISTLRNRHNRVSRSSSNTRVLGRHFVFSGGKLKRLCLSKRVCEFLKEKVSSGYLSLCVCSVSKKLHQLEFLSFDFAIGWDVQREHADSTGRAM